MISDLGQDSDLDHRLNFDQLPSLSALADETFVITEEANSEIFQNNGRLNVSFLLRNAKILLAADDYPLAKSIFQSLIEHGEALGAAYAGLGVCYEKDGKIELAIKAYREAIIYEPSYTSLIALADLFIRRQDFRDAVATLLRANHLPKIRKKESFEIHKNLGNCYLRLEQLDHAENHYRQAKELVPDSPILNVNIGCLYIQKQDISSAVLHFQEALRLDPENSSAITGLGLAYMARGDDMGAHDAFVRAVEKKPSNVTALLYLVRTAYKTAQYGPAATHLSAYIASFPYNINILYSLAGLQYHLRDFAGCAEQCEKILKLKPEHVGSGRLLELARSQSQAIA